MCLCVCVCVCVCVWFRRFNVILGLLQIIILNSTDTHAFNQVCATSYTITNRLSDFSQFRGQQTSDDSGLFHLMSNCPTGTTVGIAWLNLVCTKSSFSQSSSSGTQYVSGAAVSTIIPEQWLVVAHEIGHNFGTGRGGQGGGAGGRAG